MPEQPAGSGGLCTGPATVPGRLAALRAVMAQRDLYACVFLSSDPHVSEYLPAHWQTRQWLSGFTGSAGTLVVTAETAALWVDSRYWEQAEADLPAQGIAVMRSGQQAVPSPAQWLAGHAAAGQSVWIDFRTLSVQSRDAWQAALQPAGVVLAGEPDVLDALWPDRPALPAQPVVAHRPPHACRQRGENLAAVRDAMAALGARWHAVSSLDDIAWLLNLRGSDVPYNPVFLAHVLIGPEDARLFVAQGTLTPDLVADLAQDGVAVQDYDAIQGALATLPAGDTMLFDPARMTVALQQRFAHLNAVQAMNPSQSLKARKNADEIAHVRDVMERDGAALCEFFAWFESALGREPLTELTVDERLTEARARQADFVSPSFGTIAGFNANGAMPHYQATPRQYARIEGNGLLLIDSGGQYLGGTTDITRVVPIGRITDAQREDFTRVLQGMIALSCATFPAGTPGFMLDALARMPLWRQGLDYGHGTGHGVGYFLNVHEGPQSISPRVNIAPEAGFQAGMITSNEPGLYRPGQWGIRIENLVLAVEANTTDFGRFLAFETLTLCPIDTRCILPGMLSEAETGWLNRYHAQVRRRLAPRVNGAAADWLQERTRPI